VEVVGREREFGKVESFLDALRLGPGWLLLVGEPGLNQVTNTPEFEDFANWRARSD
jgi:hypothetical protein